MDEMATHGIPSTQERCSRACRSKAYDSIRHKPLVQTTAADLLAVLHANGNCVTHYLRRLHNLAVDLGWLAWPILAKRAWPKSRSQSKERSLPRIMEQSSLRKKTLNAARTMTSYTKL